MLEHKDKIYEELINEYIQVYLNDEDHMLKKPQLFTTYMGQEYQTYDLNIVGVSLDNNSYLSYEYINEYKNIDKYVNKVIIYDDNKSNLIQSLDKLEIEIDKKENFGKEIYGYNFEGNYKVISLLEMYKYGKIILFVLAMIFIIFSFLQFGNFVGLSISNNKKDIGILRAIGASEKDIIKIYGYESIVLAIMSWIISVFGYLLSLLIINNYFNKNNYYILNVIVLDLLSIIIMLVIIVAISILVSTTYIRKVSAIKPIDVILNK